MAERESLSSITLMDLFAVAQYPDAGFRNDSQTQSLVTSRMRRRCGRTKGLFITMAAVFFVGVGCGLVGFPAAALGGLAMMFVIFIPLAFMLIYAPALDCPHCGKRMKKDWAILESGRSGEFLICPICHVYLYTHRTLR